MYRNWLDLPLLIYYVALFKGRLNRGMRILLCDVLSHLVYLSKYIAVCGDTHNSLF